MNEKNKPKEDNVYNIVLPILVIIAVVGLCYLGFLLYDDYQNTIADYEEQIENLHSTINLKTQSLNEYKDKVNSMDKQINFMDDYVAICPADGKGLYHRYTCTQYDHSVSFYIYNISNAEQENFYPCPYCENKDNSLTVKNSDVVYITNNGSKYHRNNCSYLKSKKAITKEQAITKGYTACSRCNP